MAAKQLSKMKAKQVKRKKLLKKNKQMRQKQRKFHSYKQKKRQARMKRPAKKASTRKGEGSGEPKISSLRLASKILRQMPKVRMEAKARGLVKTLLTELYNQVVAHIETLSQKDEEATVSCTDVQTALKEAMEKELAKHTVVPPTNECA